MGLLDDFFKGTGDPQRDAVINQGLLSAGLALMQSKGRFLPALGAAGAQGMQASGALAQQQRQNKMQDWQFQQQKAQAERAARDDAQQQRLQQLPGRFSMPGGDAAVDATGGMATDPGEANNVARPQGFDQEGFIKALQGIDPIKAAQYQDMVRKQAPKLESTPDGGIGSYWDGKQFVKAIVNPKDVPPPTDTADWKDYQKAVSQGFTGQFLDYQTKMANLKSPKTTVQVNTGQKGYENESKLRNDFKSEPIYKDFQDMDQAYKQIKAGLAAKNPIGDVAAATKIMKLLDPGSVVRESELGIAMAAAGKLDRLQNYVQMQVSGQKLTPTQRTEFASLAGQLHSAASQSYNAKRQEYATMGGRYGLDPTVLGSESKPQTGGLSADESSELERLRARFRGK